MTAMRGATAGFKTGDIVICYYPEQPKQFLHLTVFLQAAHSPTRTPAFVHAGVNEVEVAVVDAYEAYAKGGHGFLHLTPVGDGAQAMACATAAKAFAASATKTPYGKATGLPTGVAAAGAFNRFAGMKATTALADIPFDLTALVRLLKWADRAHQNQALSEKRGITCAAFVSVCHQAASMITFLTAAGAIDGLRQGASQSNLMLESKAELRARTGQESIKTGKKPNIVDTRVFPNQALRANSNRQPNTGTQSTAMNEFIGSLDLSQYSNFTGHDTALNKQWFYLQKQVIGVNEWLAQPLETIIPASFFYDVKYINSMLLTAQLKLDATWRNTQYSTY